MAVDELSELMRHLRLQTRVFHRSTHCGQWTIDTEYERKAMFHWVAAGRCVLRMGEAAGDVLLEAGDAVLFIVPREHRLIATLDADETEATLLLCGYFEFASPLSSVLLTALPDQVLLRHGASNRESRRSTPAALLQLILREAEGEEPGAAALMDKLADVLFMYALRQCVVDGSAQQGPIRALSDKHLAPALLAMHREPQQAWSVASLAELGHLSRAAFARRFTETVGLAPMAYLTGWRLQFARSALIERGIAVATAAAMAGYATEAAFSRAFKRVYGHPPSACRSLSAFESFAHRPVSM